MLFAAVYADPGGNEFGGIATVDVHELLWITVCERKPGGALREELAAPS